MNNTRTLRSGPGKLLLLLLFSALLPKFLPATEQKQKTTKQKVCSQALNCLRKFLRPIYTVQFCRMQPPYDTLTT